MEGTIFKEIINELTLLFEQNTKVADVHLIRARKNAIRANACRKAASEADSPWDEVNERIKREFKQEADNALAQAKAQADICNKVILEAEFLTWKLKAFCNLLHADSYSQEIRDLAFQRFIRWEGSLEDLCEDRDSVVELIQALDPNWYPCMDIESELIDHVIRVIEENQTEGEEE